MKLFGTSKINEKGNLSIGGVDTVELAKEFKTPLYVMDQELIETTIDKMKEAFRSSRFETQIAYAGKAFLTTGMARLVDKKGLELDVVSGGELYTAYKAGFPMNRVHMHGNNKTYEELEMAIDFGIKQIVIDNEDEIERVMKSKGNDELKRKYYYIFLEEMVNFINEKAKGFKEEETLLENMSVTIKKVNNKWKIENLENLRNAFN